jgi:pimeloyl-ACP methyl ester carboxylesterase
MADLSASERTVTVADGEVLVRTGGKGPDLFVLHHDIGNHAWSPFHVALAENFTVWAPDLPGFGRSQRPEWARNARDIAALAGLTADTLGLGAITLVGLGFGGWLAAEMATLCQQRLRRLVLAAPMGIKPDEGDIFDQFLVSHEDYLREGAYEAAAIYAAFGEPVPTDMLEALDVCREMTTRIAWKPYMFNRALPALLRSVTVPTLVVRGDDDRIVPESADALYAAALPNARRQTIARCGHWIELEQPKELVRLIVEHEKGV